MIDLERRIQDLKVKIASFDSLIAEARRQGDAEALQDLEAEQAQVQQTLHDTLMIGLEDLNVEGQA